MSCTNSSFHCARGWLGNLYCYSLATVKGAHESRPSSLGQTAFSFKQLTQPKTWKGPAWIPYSLPSSVGEDAPRQGAQWSSCSHPFRHAAGEHRCFASWAQGAD
eukprot:scaffold311333_cov18-Tisochrysis_lutea.AAC.1